MSVVIHWIDLQPNSVPNAAKQLDSMLTLFRRLEAECERESALRDKEDAANARQRYSALDKKLKMLPRLVAALLKRVQEVDAFLSSLTVELPTRCLHDARCRVLTTLHTHPLTLPSAAAFLSFAAADKVQQSNSKAHHHTPNVCPPTPERPAARGSPRSHRPIPVRPALASKMSSHNEIVAAPLPSSTSVSAVSKSVEINKSTAVNVSKVSSKTPTRRRRPKWYTAEEGTDPPRRFVERLRIGCAVAASGSGGAPSGCLGVGQGEAIGAEAASIQTFSVVVAPSIHEVEGWGTSLWGADVPSVVAPTPTPSWGLCTTNTELNSGRPESRTTGVSAATGTGTGTGGSSTRKRRFLRKGEGHNISQYAGAAPKTTMVEQGMLAQFSESPFVENELQTTAARMETPCHWVVPQPFDLSPTKRPLMPTDPSLPAFLNTGLAYESAHPELVLTKLLRPAAHKGASIVGASVGKPAFAAAVPRTNAACILTKMMPIGLL